MISATVRVTQASSTISSHVTTLSHVKFHKAAAAAAASSVRPPRPGGEQRPPGEVPLLVTVNVQPARAPRRPGHSDMAAGLSPGRLSVGGSVTAAAAQGAWAGPKGPMARLQVGSGARCQWRRPPPPPRPDSSQ